PASAVRPRSRNMPVWRRFRTGPDAPRDECVDRNTVIGNLIRRSIASPSPSFGWTARDGSITTNDLRLATPVRWHFGHSNDGSAVRCTATYARIINAANPAMGSLPTTPRLRTYDAGNYATRRQRQQPPPLSGPPWTTATCT